MKRDAHEGRGGWGVYARRTGGVFRMCGTDPRKEPGDHTRVLVSRALDGDTGAMAELYEQYEKRMITDVHHRLGPTLHGLMESVDLVQSVWKDVLEELKHFEYRGPDSFRRWLHACLINKIRTKRRYHVAARRDVKKAGPLHTDPVPFDRVDPTPSQVLINHEEQEQLLKILKSFPPVQRQVLILRMRDQMKYEAIGRSIGKSTEAVKKIYNRSMKKLIGLLPPAWRDEAGVQD